MIDFSHSPVPVRPDIVERLHAAWDRLGRPGTWFSGSERVQLAAVARAARAGDSVSPNSPAEDVVVRIAADPASTSEAWVDAGVTALGNEERYVEGMGIAARTVMADTFARLLGLQPFDLPDPHPGLPAEVLVEPRPQKIRSWITVGPALVPPHAQALVPDENDLTYPLIEALYITGAAMENPDHSRGSLHRTQMELIAATVSYGNECFY